MSVSKEFFSVGVLSEEDFLSIKKEIFPFFSEKFQRSSTTYKQDPYNENVRKSLSKFIYPKEIPETVVIATLLLNGVIKNNIYVDLPDIQLLKYDIGNHFYWHQDVIETNDKVRIMTMSINLNDDYEGGGLEFKYKTDLYSQEKIPGAYCIFPSFCMHRALTVTAAQRRAITFWFMGNQETLNTLRNLYDSKP